MFAHHLGMHRIRRQVQLATQHLAQARGVEHRAGAEHTLRRQAAGFDQHPHQHVDRVADHHHRAGKAGQRAADVAGHAGVVAQQVEPGFVRPAAAACRHHHHLGVAHLLDAGGAHLAGRIEPGAVGQVHGLALGTGRIQVLQPQLVGRA